jgi:malonyl CoA-acyl carrier protein transacylase
MSQNSAASPDYQALMKQALLELRDMRTRLNAVETAKTEPIAIIGLGCRFPGADDPDAFWQLLIQGMDAITEVPPDRWDIDAFYDPDPHAPGKMSTRYGGFVRQLYEFDPHFFGLSPREAVTLDPQQRLLLEVSWEALEQAGLSPDRLAGSQTGVFVGICSSDYSQILLDRGVEAIDAYMGTGNTHSVAAGRLSYLLGLQGPSLSVDTACSSSLVTVHLACQSLRNGECDLALVGGVNRILTPEATINFSKAQMLAADGRCKTFDADANGYVRAEGCGMVVLKRLSQALADRDNILALIKGSAINQDGRSSGLTVPNGPAQQALIRQALQSSGLEPSDVSYIEAHGTGTALGDPIEVGALGAVFGEGRSPQDPLVIGSVKTNIGHLEGAAGIAGLIKVVLSLQHQEIPPHLHFKQPNPHIDWQDLPLKIPTEPMSWKTGSKPRIAGVSSFGFSGTNAHVVLAEAPCPEPLPETADRPLHLLSLSARTESALTALASRYQQHLTTHPTLNFADVCFTTNTGRSHFEHRLSLVAASTKQAIEKLTAFIAGQETTGVLRGRKTESSEVAFLFTGQGSQYVGMGRQLYETQPIFRAAIDRCNKILLPYLDKPLLEVLYPKAGELSLLNETVYTQPALFALEYSLAQLWQAWGIQPDVVMGHSVGEYVAACTAGIFSLEDGLKLIAHRGQLMQALPQNGRMVAVLASEARVAQVIQPYPEVAIAAINGPQSVVISGETAAVQAVCAELEADGAKLKPLAVSHAFHSPLMEPMLAAFAEVANSITYSPPHTEIISNVTGKLAAPGEMTTPDYWCRHIRQPVRFADSFAALHQHRYQIFLEVGPKPVLLGMGYQCIPAADVSQLALVSSLRPGQDDWQTMLESLGQLYGCGLPIAWSEFDREYGRRQVTLPTYPFQRQSYRVSPTERRSPITETPQTPIIQLLQKGETEQLAQLLNQAGQFSDEQRAVLPELLTALVKQHQQQAAFTTLQNWFYEVEWQLSPRQSQVDATEARSEPGIWLILADQKGVGQALAQQLTQQGHHCAIAHAGTGYHREASAQWTINPVEPSHFEQWCQEIVEQFSLPWRGVVHLWSLDVAQPDVLTLSTLKQAQILGCASAMHLVQALSQHPRNTPRLWLVTQGAMPIAQSLPAIAQTPLWGMGRVISLEHPQFWGGMIDLAPEFSQDEILTLSTEIQNAEGEDHIAFRARQRYVARLVQTAIQEPKPVSFHSDRTYLITGGLGSLGLQVAQWMVEQGGKSLVLTGRRSPSPEAQKAIAHLEQLGATVFIAQADVAALADMAEVLETINTSMPPLAGIIHAAGVSSPQALADMNLEALESMLSPKLAGSWNLHTLTQNIPLDFFVNFSSISAVWGSKGLAHYAAANHFLDGLAHYRRRLGLPALSVNWGPWAEAGMATGDSQADWLSRRGLKGLSSSVGLSALASLLSSDRIQTTVAGVNWTIFKSLYESGGARPLLQQLGEPARSARIEAEKKEPDPIWQDLEALPPEERQGRLVTYLQAEVGKVLGITETSKLPEPQQGFFDMGMDSLMALELKNRLEVSLAKPLPATLVIEAPTLRELAKYLTKEVLGWELLSLNSNEVVREATTDTMLTEVEELADAEVDGLLEQELAELETLLMED